MRAQPEDGPGKGEGLFLFQHLLTIDDVETLCGFLYAATAQIVNNGLPLLGEGRGEATK